MKIFIKRDISIVFLLFLSSRFIFRCNFASRIVAFKLLVWCRNIVSFMILDIFFNFVIKTLKVNFFRNILCVVYSSYNCNFISYPKLGKVCSTGLVKDNLFYGYFLIIYEISIGLPIAVDIMAVYYNTKIAF